MSGYTIGYGRGEIEPKIAPLVDAVQKAGFVTFSSCEGHEEREARQFGVYTSVAFYAREDEAKLVHSFLLRYRERLLCSWCLRGSFVAHRETDEFVLGWTLENLGMMQEVEKGQLEWRTLQAAWTEDIPTLSGMFAGIAAQRRSTGPSSSM